MEKEYRNKELPIREEDFNKFIENDFIGDDFTDQLEWAMLMISGKFKQMRFAEYLSPITASHFDKAYLFTKSSHGLDKKIIISAPFSGMAATPEIFPLINVKVMTISDIILLQKIKEIDSLNKRKLNIKHRYAFEYSYAIYGKDTESFYGRKDGYGVNPSFFNLLNSLNNKDDKIDKSKYTVSSLPVPIPLHSNYYFPSDILRHADEDMLLDAYTAITNAYQVALSMYYEWCIYIKEYDNIGLIIPIEPSMLSEIYKTSITKFDNPKRMIHFVKDHYRRKIARENEDYSIYVHKYLRGEYKFDYRSFRTDIIPPRYDLNRVKTRKKFIKPEEDSNKIIY